MAKTPVPLIFKTNPFKDVIEAVLAGNQSEMYRRLKNPKSGWTALRTKHFPTSASEANHPQKLWRVD